MRLALAMALLLAGCGKGTPAEAPPEEAPLVEPPPSEPVHEEPAPAEAPSAPEGEPESAAEQFVPALEEGAHGCFSVSSPVRLAEGAGTAEVIAHARGYAIALYAHDGTEERVEVHAGSPRGAPRLVESFTLARATRAGRAAAPSLASLDGGGLLLAYVDRDGTVHVRRVGKPRTDREVAARVDLRFPPAIAPFRGGALLAYTAGEGEGEDVASHVYAVRLDENGKAGERVDVTPIAGGASAPSFVRGAKETLAFVDARLGFSPVYVRRFGEKLADPIEPELLRPLSHMLEPAQLVVAMHRGEAHIGYTGRGADMGSAIGWVRVGKGAAVPASVVSPRGLGPLRVDVDVLPEGALLFVGDAPLAREANAPREVHVRRLEADRLGEAIRLRGSDGTAARPSIAALGGDDVVVVYSTARGIELVHLECD